ncbi:MAG: nuclear transport factor 2 family protein [Thermoleophilaceae bacterium]|nr:nuclear transport factor 2 family protein [Thermoleophilaceae bacterium]
MGPDLARQFVAAFNSRDADAAAAMTAPDAVLVPLRASVDATTYRGPNGMREFFAASDVQWEGLHMEVDSEEREGDQVLLIGRLTARSRDVLAPADNALGLLLDFADGMLVGARSFPDPQEAEEAFRRNA